MRAVRVAIVIGFILSAWMTSLVMAEPPRQGGESNLDEGVFILDCYTGERIIGGLKFTFVNVNPGYYYRISAIGIDGFDPVMAVLTAPNYGSCNDDYPDLAGSQVAVPELGLLEADARSSQVTINTDRSGNIDVLVGGYEGVSGRFAIVIEGLSIDPSDEADGFLVSVPEIIQSDLMSIYMISRDDSSLDPYIEAYYGEGLQGVNLDFDNTESFAWCDDVGSAECPGTAPFPGGGVLINNGFRYEAGYIDAGLGVTPNTTDRLLYVLSSSGSGSSGEYGILVIGTAPGELGDTPPPPPPAPTSQAATEECIPAYMSVDYVSDEYDSRYSASALLDGNRDTGWSSESYDGTHYVGFVFDQPYTINRLYFNSYPASGTNFAEDAIQDFYVSAIDWESEEEITIIDATAPFEPGYWIYEFESITTDEVYVEFISNYGGDYFEASDLVFCQE